MCVCVCEFVARMEDERIPKALLFGSFPNKRPAHGPRKRWRDCVRSDVKPLDDWYEVATSSRSKWRKAYRCLPDKQNRPRPSPVVCQTCHRSFSRVSDRTRHKCTATRALALTLSMPACFPVLATHCSGAELNCSKLHAHI